MSVLKQLQKLNKALDQLSADEVKKRIDKYVEERNMTPSRWEEFKEFLGWFRRSLWHDGVGGFDISWSLLQLSDRYWGFSKDYYDGPIWCFGFWYGHIYLVDASNSIAWHTAIESLKEIIKKDIPVNLLSPNKYIRGIAENLAKKEKENEKH